MLSERELRIISESLKEYLEARREYIKRYWNVIYSK